MADANRTLSATPTLLTTNAPPTGPTAYRPAWFGSDDDASNSSFAAAVALGAGRRRRTE
jgi:hypothetical protein